MGRLRDVDRRVAARAWTRVRRPSLPAWVWFVIDVAAGGLITTGFGELVALAYETTGQIIQALGFFAVVAIAIGRFMRSTRGSPRHGQTPGRRAG